MLEHVVELPEVWPSLVMEVAVADCGYDEYTSVRHNSLVSDYLGRQGLHHLDRVCPHSVSIVEVCRHAEYDAVILLLCKRYICTLVGACPRDWLHLLCVS